MKRLFIPLCSDPFNWFLSGEKEWELRKQSGQFNPDRIEIGSYAELRRGYSAKNGICWGKVTDCKSFTSLKDVFSVIPYQKIIKASSLTDAKDYTCGLLGISYDSQVDLVAIKIEKIDIIGEILFHDRYFPLLLSKMKTTTIRQGIRHYQEGYYNAINNDKSKCVLIRVIKTEIIEFGLLTDINATSDGYQSAMQLKSDLLKFYPSLSYDSPMTIISFEEVLNS